ncbi:hypothetical protein BCV72DRAFT_226149 [Rhizopus microsporus var. microsporus]|uniref:Yeast cell wall synthesis Kre9/Knh1-like N-terminal domain-containing protein n=1 Tax=Rhizopus microsporus var. microsporus TaxID=86635 RepID=A0A1X0R6U3_RHIZD|nr:hypothetical protein BCV72DRAFT_226149 [Rhizopus microsporus var. microsporus]
MKFSVAAILALAVSAVSAQTNIVSVTSPLTGTVYTAGKPAIISWINPQVSSISKIVLAQGESTNLQPVSTIAENVDASSGSYTWNVPSDITPGNNYALELGTSPNISYTGMFTIQAGDGSSASSASASSSASNTIANGAASASVASSASSAAASVTSVAASATSAAASASRSAASSASSAVASVASSASSSAAAAATSAQSAGFKVTASKAIAGAAAAIVAAVVM